MEMEISASQGDWRWRICVDKGSIGPVPVVNVSSVSEDLRS